MRVRTITLDAVVAAVFLAYAWAFPRLSDLAERSSLTAIAVVATAACLWAAFRPGVIARETRAVWLRCAATAGALVAHWGTFFWRAPSEPSSSIRGVMVTGFATLSLCIGGSALMLVVRPLLSYSATRRHLRRVGPVGLLGGLTLPLADPYFLPIAGGLVTALSVTVSLAVTIVIVVALARVAPVLAPLGRTAELCSERRSSPCSP